MFLEVHFCGYLIKLSVQPNIYTARYFSETLIRLSLSFCYPELFFFSRFVLVVMPTWHHKNQQALCPWEPRINLELASITRGPEVLLFRYHYFCFCFPFTADASTQRRLLLLHAGPHGAHGDRRGAQSAQPAGLACPSPPYAVRPTAAAQQPPAAPRQPGGQQRLWGLFLLLQSVFVRFSKVRKLTPVSCSCKK